MNRMLYWVVLPAVSLVPLLQGGEKTDTQQLNGTWLATSVELAGQKLPDETLQSIKLLLKDGTYTVTIGEQTDRGTFKLDAAKKPKAMDIVGTDGPNKGKTFLAIYELNGDSLKVCYDLSGMQRPAEYATKPKTALFLATYKREK